MKRIRTVGLIALVVAFSLSLGAISHYKNKLKLAKQNETALLNGMKEIEVENEAYGVQVNALQLSLKQYKKYRAEDAKKLKDMGVKLKNLEAVAKHYAEINAELEGTVKDTTIVHKVDSIYIEKELSKIEVVNPFIKLEGWIDKDKFNGKIHVPANLTQTIEAEYRYRFLWWRWGLKGFKQKISSDNPYVKIKYSEFIRIK